MDKCFNASLESCNTQGTENDFERYYDCTTVKKVRTPLTANQIMNILNIFLTLLISG